MMLMGIDSSIRQASVALLSDGKVLAQAEVVKNATASNQLLFLIDKVLTSFGVNLQ